MLEIQKVEDRPHKGLTTSLIVGIMLAMGPLFGAIVSVFVMMYRTAAVREMVVQGVSDGVVPFPLLPVIVGFSLFPVGLVLVWFSVMQFSHHVSSDRKKRH
ncbi:MAG: hypothetical protein ISS35_00105 [Kiritimatiellae bacterium]|nr:hypothetical protein [Kiritimatiellia bacterium]